MTHKNPTLSTFPESIYAYNEECTCHICVMIKSDQEMIDRLITENEELIRKNRKSIKENGEIIKKYQDLVKENEHLIEKLRNN